jgi:hypothetical protein
MGDWRDDVRAARLLRLTAAAYAVTVAVHFADHLRRGLDASPDPVIALGTLATVLQAVAVVAALARWALAPVLAAAIGASDAVGTVVVHLLPKWSALSDPFPGDEAVRVTAFSWVSALFVIAAGLAFAWAGFSAWRRGAPAPSARSAS